MRERKYPGIWLAILVLIAILCTNAIATEKIIYVDDDAAGDNNGSSWKNAYNYLQDALADANDSQKHALSLSNGPVEIRVAQGIYKPNQGLIPIRHGGIGRGGVPYPERYPADEGEQATFCLINNVAIKGGFAGIGEPDPNQRDIEAYETILSGDLNGDDIYVNDPCDLIDEPTRRENSNRIVNASGADASTVLDGFTVIAGFGPFGAGMGNHNGNPTLINCTFKGNTAYHDYGGGILNGSGNPTIINCTFTKNYAVVGGGMCSISSNPTLTNCIFTNNYAEFGGGGMYNMHSEPKVQSTRDSNSTLINCTFNNNAGFWGGGMFNDRSDSDLSNCTFNRNHSRAMGAGMFNAGSNIVMSDCLFVENTGGSGGGIYSEDNSSLTLTNCTLMDNMSNLSGGGMCNSDTNDIKLTDCKFLDNSAIRAGGGMIDGSNNAILINCIFSGNKASGDQTDTGKGGGIYLSGDAEIINCAFRNNWSQDGAGIYVYSSNLKLIECNFTGNIADAYGGGVYNGRSWNYLNVSIGNCAFSGNTAKFGGGVFNTWASCIGIVNCTFTDNIASGGKALSCDPSHASPNGYIKLNNCIIWEGNNALFDYNPEGLTYTINYSNIQGGWEGEGNIDFDPLFVDSGYWVDANDPNVIVVLGTPYGEPNDPNAMWIEGDYHLKSQAGRWDPNSEIWVVDDVTSPCINAGDPNSPVGGEPEPNGGRINMGVYDGTAEASKSPAN